MKASLAEVVTSPVVQAHAARLSGLPDGEVVIRIVLAFIMWPASDGDHEERTIAAMLPTAGTSHPGTSG